MSARLLPVYLSREEVHRMISAARSERERLLIWLLWVTGARVSEVLQARWGDVTESGIRLPNLKQRRTGLQEKHVLLPPEAVALLRERAAAHRPSELIFPGRDGRPMSRVTAWRVVTGAAARAGLFRRRRDARKARPAWPHTLRHSYAVHLLRNGVPITLVQRQLGHRSLQATQVYTQLADPHAEALVRAVEL